MIYKNYSCSQHLIFNLLHNGFNMEIKIEKQSKNVLIHLAGKFDIENTRDFELKFMEVMADVPPNIGIGCKSLSFIDSSGIGSLIKCLNTTKNKGNQLFLVEVPANILGVFRLAKLDMFFKIYTAKEYASKFSASDSDDIDDLIDSL